MPVRPAEERDFGSILKIYENARHFMVSKGNPTQWGNTEPREELLRMDLREGHLYVVERNRQVIGVFAFIMGEDPTYLRIEEGEWHSNRPYGTIHRVASNGSGGVFRACLDYCSMRCDYLRMDTHRNNLVMQGQLEKNGFVRCGIIHVADGTPRIAFDRLKA